MENLKRDFLSLLLLFFIFFCFIASFVTLRLLLLLLFLENTRDGVIHGKDVYISQSFSLKMDSIARGFLKILGNTSIFCKIRKVQIKKNSFH